MSMDRCQVCGRTPAAQLTLRRPVGMLIMQKFFRAKPTLCRDHGRQVAKQWLTKTLVQGWWGIVSFFVNFVAVGTDIAALRKASKLAARRTPRRSGAERARSKVTAPSSRSPSAPRRRGLVVVLDHVTNV